jgi:uncharacterized protein YndB with AHSA1/START domain/quinol monooxygenase YgiN
MSQADARRLVVRRRFRATPEELFHAWTDPAGMGAWMCPGDIVSTHVQMDLRVGGALRIVMRDREQAYEHRGEFTVIEPPRKLAFTWIADATGGERTLVTVELIAISETETELVLTHEGFPQNDARDRYQNGWSRIVGRLEARLEEQRMRKKTDLVVIAAAKAQPGKEKALEQALRDVAKPTRGQPGCVSFSLYRSAENPAVIVGHERWASREDHERHLRGAHVQALLSAMASLLAEPPHIVSYQIVDEE